MLNIYGNLIAILNNWQATDEKTRKINRQVVKDIADKLSDDSTSIDHRLDAAFCYYISGYYVHAATLSNVDLYQAHIIQRWILLFLAKRFKDLKTEVLSIVNDPQFQDANIKDGIDKGELDQFVVVNRIVQVKVAIGLLNIIDFIETGNPNQNAHAVNIFSICQKLLFKVGEWQVWWWIEILKIINQEFVENSLWQALRPMQNDVINSDIVFKYITANYQKHNIVEFWRTQIESLPKINDSERCSFCISVPASAGKTKAAELAILRFLLDYRNEPDTKCVYIAPLRKLCQEVEQALTEVFDWQQTSIVSKFYGGYEIDVFDEYFFARSRILVVTPEKLDGLLRQYPDLALQIRLVIADEGHIIGGEDPKYRFLLQRLIYMTTKGASSSTTSKSRIVMLSGVLPNAADFADLISGSRDNVVNIDWRPVDEPRITSWAWDGTLFKTTNVEIQPPLIGSTVKCKNKNSFTEHAIKVAVESAKWSETLVFSASRTAITNKDFLAFLACIAKQKPFGEFVAVPDSLKKHKEYTLLIESGIAIHHKKLPTEIKREIEKRIFNNDIRLLLASPTLAQGVNIPFDTVFIYDLQHDSRSSISDPVFWNVVGRVGRPISQLRKTGAKVEHPKVIFLQNISKYATSNDRKNIRRSNELIDNRGKYKVATPFLEFLNQIKNLNHNLSIADLVIGLAEKPALHNIIGELASFPWKELTLEKYLVKLDSLLIDLLHETCQNVEITLDWLQQSSKELMDLFTKASTIKPEDLDFIRAAVSARLQFVAMNISKEKRQQEYMLGLPYDDCEKIKQNRDELLAWYSGCIDLFTNNLRSGTENLVNILDFVCSLSICSTKGGADIVRQDTLPTFDPRPKETARKRLLSGWLEGMDTESLQKVLKLFSPKQDFSQYQEQTLERELPWGVSAIARYLSETAKASNITFPADFEYISSMIRHGVNSKIACHLRRLNIPRRYAIQISQSYVQKHSSNFDNEINELFSFEFENAIKAIHYLSAEDIETLGVDDSTRIKLQQLVERYPLKAAIFDFEPEFPPFEELLI